MCSFWKFGRKRFMRVRAPLILANTRAGSLSRLEKAAEVFFYDFMYFLFIDFLYPTPAWGKRQHQKSIIPRAPQLQFVKRRCSSASPLRGFISCSYPGLKAGWSLTGGVQLRKLSRECSSEIVLTIPACWKMCLGPGGLGNPVYFILELVKVVW